MNTIDFEKAKQRIALVWFILSPVIIILVLLLEINGKFTSKSSEAWGWLFSNILPTLTLMLSVFFYDSRNNKPSFEINRFYFNLAMGSSLFYLALLFAVILGNPFTGLAMVPWMQKSTIILGPIQSIAAGAIGIFFLNRNIG